MGMEGGFGDLECGLGTLRNLDSWYYCTFLNFGVT